ncbi:MAG: hypothetical protein CM15mP127_14170 [Gammaproteobacteria bacterium]|nr:MAG: hypothetical protein CM15mP127_14170 [Gammaproteobacteria bacterium]
MLGLSDINIDIVDKSIQVIMGLSGSGKSTLIRHINRLIEPTAGNVLVDGSDVLKYDENTLREFRRTRTAMVSKDLPYASYDYPKKCKFRIRTSG